MAPIRASRDWDSSPLSVQGANNLPAASLFDVLDSLFDPIVGVDSFHSLVSDLNENGLAELTRKSPEKTKNSKQAAQYDKRGPKRKSVVAPDAIF